MSMVYKEGKVTVTQGSTKLVGIGTKFLNPIFNIFTGQIVQIRSGDKVLVNTIDEVVSDTEIKLAFDSPETATDVDYVILMTTVDSISDAANKIVAMTKNSMVLAEIMVDWFTLTGEVEVTLPDGSKVTVMSITEIQNQLSQKATKDSMKGFYKMYKSKTEADADLPNRVDGDNVLIWSDDKSTYGFYKVTLGAYELVEAERKVATINNVKPDDTGNVQITLPGGNPSLWLGEVTWFPYDQGGVGYSGLLPADGQEHLRADYPDTWAAIEGGLIASVSEEKWQAGENLVFSTGDGSTTFRVPNLMQGQALSAAKKGDKGSKVLEQVPYIKMINGKSPDADGNITIEGEIEKRVDSYGGNNFINWKGSHYMTGTVGSKSGDDERIALDTTGGRTQIAVNGGGGGWRYFGLPATGGAIATENWVGDIVSKNDSNKTTTLKATPDTYWFVSESGAKAGMTFKGKTSVSLWGDGAIDAEGSIRGVSEISCVEDLTTGCRLNLKTLGGVPQIVSRNKDETTWYSLKIPKNNGTITTIEEVNSRYTPMSLPFVVPDNIGVSMQRHWDFRAMTKSQINWFPDYPFGMTNGLFSMDQIWGNGNMQYMGLINFRGWSDSSGNAANMQFIFGNDQQLYYRTGLAGGNSMGAAWTIRSERNTTVDGNGFVKKSSPVIKLFPGGECETNNESEGVTSLRVGVGVYKINGVLGYNADGGWGVNGGISVPKDINGNEMVFIKDLINKDGSITIMTYHRKGSHLPVMFQNNRLKETLKDGTKVYYEDGEPCDLPESTYLDVRVQMPEDSIYNLKQKEGLKASSPIIFNKGEN